jgi:hypothetical protein
MASGHVNRINRPNTWLHRPMLQNVKKALANTEPSTHGTSRTCDDANGTSAVEARADMRRVFVRASPGRLCAGNSKTYCASPLSEGALYSCDNRNHCERIGASYGAVPTGLCLVTVGSK